jgi:hypothetical protein
MADRNPQILGQMNGSDTLNEVDTAHYLAHGITLLSGTVRTPKTVEELHEIVAGFNFRGGLKIGNPTWADLRANPAQITFVLLNKDA